MILFEYHLVVIIRRLIWEPANIRHMARHNIDPNEVGELHKNFHILKPAPKKRLILLGETETGRVLELVLVPKGKGIYHPLSAYEASPEMTALYKRKKGVND